MIRDARQGWRLSRMAPLSGTAPEGPRLAPPRSGRGPERDGEIREPVAHHLAGPWPERFALGVDSRASAGAVARTAADDSRVSLARSRSLRLSRLALDVRADRQGDRGGVRR